MTLRAQIEAVSHTLRELHALLITRARAKYERERGPVGGPGAFLHLLMNDAEFAWLRPMSSLIADVDHFTSKARDELGADVPSSIRREVEALFSNVQTSGELQDANVAVAYAAVKRALEALPASAAADPAEDLHAAHAWNEIRRHRSAQEQ